MRRTGGRISLSGRDYLPTYSLDSFSSSSSISLRDLTTTRVVCPVGGRAGSGPLPRFSSRATREGGPGSGSERGLAPKSLSRATGTVSLEISRRVSKTPTPLTATASTQGEGRGVGGV